MHELIAKEQEDAMFLDLHIGPVIGTHVGPGMIAIVFLGTGPPRGPFGGRSHRT